MYCDEANVGGHKGNVGGHKALMPSHNCRDLPCIGFGGRTTPGNHQETGCGWCLCEMEEKIKMMAGQGGPRG